MRAPEMVSTIKNRKDQDVRERFMSKGAPRKVKMRTSRIGK
jgi:hypothetical protein